MRNKLIAALVVVGLVVVAVVAIVTPAGEAIGGSRIEKVFVDAQGNPVVGVKELADQEVGWPEQHYYTQGPFAIRASKGDADAIGALLRRTVELEYEAMLTANQGSRVDAIRQEYDRIYSDAKGDLAKHLSYIDRNAELLVQDGYAQKELRLTRFAVKDIEVNGDEATAIVEEETLGIRERTREQPTPDVLTIRNGRQIKFYLVREEGAWMILGEDWAFLPGMEP